MSGSKRFMANAIINWAASASAGVANIICMRMSELEKGISVYGKDKKDIGKSQLAAKEAIT
jgi:hypothetical protein